MAHGLTIDSRPYRWPWHGAFEPARTGLLVVVDALDPSADAIPLARLLRVARAAAVAGISIGELPGTGGITALPDDVRDWEVKRPHLGGFSGTDIDSILRRRGLTDLIMAGFPFELGADCTMRQANDLGYECLALTDCCTGLTADTLAGAISSIQMSGGIFGAVAGSATVLELFAHQRIVASWEATKHQ